MKKIKLLMQNDWLELQLFEKACRISCDFRIMPVNNKYFAWKKTTGQVLTVFRHNVKNEDLTLRLFDTDALTPEQVAERIIQIWRKA